MSTINNLARFTSQLLLARLSVIIGDLSMPPSAPFSSALHDRLIGADEVARRLHVSRRTLYRRLAQHRIPPPAERRPGCLAKWRESDIDNFIAGLRPE